MISKHKGDYNEISSIWKKENEENNSKQEKSEFMCKICEMNFDSLELLNQHLVDGLLPSSLSLTFQCNICQKKFRDERALKQHSNFCKFK